MDDMYPNDGAYFYANEPADQVVSRKKEKASTLQGLKVLKDLIARLEQRIEFYGTVDAIPDELKDDPIKFMNMHNANQIVRDNLRSEMEYIISLMETHAPNL